MEHGGKPRGELAAGPAAGPAALGGKLVRAAGRSDQALILGRTG